MMSIFYQFSMNEEWLNALMKFQGEEISVSFVLDEDDDNESKPVEIEDFQEVIALGEEVMQQLNSQQYEKLKQIIAKEMIKTVYGYIDIKNVHKEEYDILMTNLRLHEVECFSDGAVMLILRSKELIPDMEVVCQVNRKLELEDCSFVDIEK